MRIRGVISLWVMLLFIVIALPVGAQEIIIPEPPHPPMPPTEDVAVKSHHARVTINEQVAVTRIEQTLVNDRAYDVEVDYILPLPEGAQISRFAMWVDGQILEARLLDADEARDIYEEIVREWRDPALLEFVGRGAFRTRIFPVPAHGETRIEIEYVQVLPAEGGLVRYGQPLRVAGMTPRTLDEVSVSVTIRSTRPIGAVYSPAQSIAVHREDDGHVEVGYEALDVTPEGEFVLYYGMEEDDLGVGLLTYKERGEDGYFLLLLSPRPEADPQEVVARDLFIVLDVSGSMRGEKMEQAKAAVRYVLDRLNPEDRFNIIAFSTGTHRYASEPRPAAEVEQAHTFIRDLQAAGGTNISRALQETLSQARGERPQVVLFFTDGLATEGEIRTAHILEQVADATASMGDRVSIYCFGVGYEVNTTLLDTMAQSHRGTTVYVRPEEDIEHAVATFYSRIGTPVLSDVSLSFDGVQVDDTYPYPLPDLFAGSQLVVAGRYRDGGTAGITLRGMVNDEPREQRFPAMNFHEDGGDALVPRLWATRKIGHLLAQIRLHGADGELVDEIIALSVRHGIVTPYTSYLVDETEDALTAEGRRSIAERQLAEAPAPAGQVGQGEGALSIAADASGQKAVEESIAQESLRQADVAAAPEAEQVRVVGAKAFVLRDDTWIDTTYDAGSMRMERVPLGGERYFDLLQTYPEWGLYLALGQRVTLVWEGVAYQIEPGDAEPASAPTRTPTVSVEPTVAPPSDMPSPQPTTAPTPEAVDSTGSWWQSLWVWFVELWQ